MNVLLIGSGGREHALAWKIAASPLLTKLYAAPGNPGIAGEAELVQLSPEDHGAIVAFCRARAIDLVVVGPEAPLVAGLGDRLREAGIRVFGGSGAAARLEGSKGFTKDLCARYGIPTAAYGRFSDAAAARAHVRRNGAPIVVKADGLAAGKGVVVAMSLGEAHAAVDRMLPESGRPAMATAARVVIEEFLEGEEASFICMVDGRNVLPLASSQDHKRIGDGDQGPNTGGMGAYSPAPVVTPEVHARVMREIIVPTVRGMAADGIPYTGFLYAGLMIARDGSVKTVEFNCRLGDPEAQPIMMRLKSDLPNLLDHAVSGRLDLVEASWDRRVALGVVLAAANYPETPRTGDPISGLPRGAEDFHIFHAGTSERDGQMVTSGGRVLCVTTLSDNIRQAQKRAYDLILGIHFEGMQYRRDIGHRAAGR